ncbi:MAG: hypothetical protein EXS50_01195 [Candidatus Taylorbacteria bacterium]|nr:hypothetical protein [Candidatus Taylorbacteria bacterium]
MKNKQKGSTIQTVLIIIVLLIVVGGVYFYQNKKVDQASQLQTYTDVEHGFSIKYPTGTNVRKIDGNGVFGISLKPSGFQGELQATAHYAVLGSNQTNNCDDTASGLDRTVTNINGVDFLTFSMSKKLSGSYGHTSATEYCALVGNTAYKLITRVDYVAGSSNGLDLDRIPVLNQMIASFKLTK